jgi:hypothetical protein
MVKKTRKLLIGGRKKRKKTRTKRGGDCAEDLELYKEALTEERAKVAKLKTPKGVGKTKHFELRRGDSFGELVDIYLSDIDSYGKAVTEKHLMDDIFKKVEELAVKKTSDGKMNSLYDGFNYLSTIIDMRTQYMTEDTYITPEITIEPASQYLFSETCVGKDVLMKWKISLNTDVDLYNNGGPPGKTHQPMQGIDPGLLFKRLKDNLLSNFDVDRDFFPKIVIPITIPDHSLCCILDLTNIDRGVTLYLADPNGYRSSDTSNPYLKRNQFAQITMDCKNALLTEAKKAGIIYMGDLLCDLSPQTLGLQFIDSGGFCGGFTAFICFLFLNNPGSSTKGIGKYIMDREEQWHKNAKHDWEKLTRKLWDEFETVDIAPRDKDFDNPLMYNNDKGLYVPITDFSTIKNKKMQLWDKSIFKFGGYVRGGSVKYKGKKISTKEEYRRALLEILGDEVPLDWFECHIIMFLVYLDEYNERFSPLNFYGREAWKQATPMLYDNGKNENFEDDSADGDAGVRKYPGVHCHLNQKDKKGWPEKVGEDYNIVCMGKNPKRFEKKFGRKPNGSTHNS